MPKRQDAQPHRFELRGIVQEFLTDYRDNAKTHAYYADQLGRAWLSFADQQNLHSLSDVTSAVIRDYLDAERLATYEIGGHVRRHKPQTIYHRHRALRRLFAWCIERGYAEENPCARVRTPKVPHPVEGGFTREECQRLINESRRGWGWLGFRDHAIVMVLLDTGCRAGGLLGMTTSSIDWTRRRLRLREKGGKERFVPLGARAQLALKEYMRRRPEARTDAFWLTLRKRPMGHSTLGAMLDHLGKYAHVPGVHPHRFRHTYASLWYEEHRDIMALRNLLGHSKIETTERYLRTLGHVYGTDDSFRTPTEFIS